MLRIREAIVVEGRYDKNTLSQLVDTLILETAGFGIFKNEEQMALLRRVAAQRGLIVLTDPDGAGFVIRNRLKGAIPQEQLKHAYVPDILGKERRKAHPGKEGKLGVEGMTKDVLVRVLEPFISHGACQENAKLENARMLTKLDFFTDGLSGGADSSKKREELARALGFPHDMSANALIEAINLTVGYDGYAESRDNIFQKSR